MSSIRTRFSPVVVAALLFSAACGFQRGSGTTGVSPSSTTVTTSTPTPSSPTPTVSTPSYVGTWATALAPTQALNPSTCGNLTWAISSQTATTVSGTFSATCAGGISLSGTATGQIGNLQSVPIQIDGVGTLPGIASCAFSIQGTGTVIDNNTALQVVYTGTTCLGPIRGTETLRKKSSTPDPTPAPTPDPTPTPAPAPDPGLDQMNLYSAAVYNSPRDVASWPITTRITRLETVGCNGGISLQFEAQNRWPDYTPPGWDGPLQYTLWAVVNINGQWNTSGYIQFWRGRENTGAPILPLECGFPVNWAYDGRWGPMNGYRPSVGEQMGFFVTAGDARNVDGVTSLRERSNVVVVPLPANYGVWSW
ncbi:MAG: hypothetical protein U0Q11_21540 [Vicinamibacterales bacterium]